MRWNHKLNLAYLRKKNKYDKTKRKHGKHSIIWFNTALKTNVHTNVGRIFLK